MADVITRFKLETTQYDSKLREASKSLAEYTRQATKAGSEFKNFTQKNVEAARALGNITPSANNAKEKVKELVGAFNDAAKAYNALTKEQQQSDFGKALSASLTQLNAKIKEAKQELYGIGEAAKKVEGGGLFSGLGDKMSGALAVFGGNLMTKAAGAVAQLGSEMVDMVQQGVELAKQGEGIRIAFERLGRGDILDGLRQATHGTVTDLELMKAAVKFNDFKLPVEELGTMLAFAQQKAKDTGQSVDYMVDSIVTGLGRKSLMILDNLGLSANEIKEKMKETGDMTKAVGAIIRDQMSKAGDYVETAADRAAQANVSLQNKMEELGRKFGPVEEASNQLWTSMKIGILDIVGGPLARLLNGLTEAGRLKNALNDINGGSGGGETLSEKHLRLLREYSGGGKGMDGKRDLYSRQVARYNELEANAWKQANSLREQLKGLRKQAMEKPGNFQPLINDVTRQLEKAESTAKAWRQINSEYQTGAKSILNPAKVSIDTSGAEQNITSLTKKLKDLQEQRKKAIAAGDSDLSKNLLKQINQTKADIKGLGGSVSTSRTSHKVTDQERAAQKVAAAYHEYEQTIEKAKMSLDNGTSSEADYKKKLLSAEERLWDALGDAYQVHADPKYKQAQDECAKNIQQLGGEVTASVEAQKKAQEAARQLAQTQKRVNDALEESARAYTSNDLKGYLAAQKKVGGDAGAGMTGEAFTYTSSNLDAFIGSLKERISTADLGSELYNNLTKQLTDATALGNLMQEAIKQGIDIAQFDPQDLWRKVFGDNPGDYIEDDQWDKLVEKINEKLADRGINISLDNTSGAVSSKGRNNPYLHEEGGKTYAKINELLGGMASGVGQIVSGLEQLGVKIPEGFKSALGVMQGISTILTGIASTLLVIRAIQAADFFKLFAHGGVVHAASGFAGVVPGNMLSGDNIPALLNSGEVVLNRAQAGNVASQLQDNGGGMTIVGELSGEKILLVANRYLKRKGEGEIVTWSFN